MPRWWAVGLVVSILWFTWELLARERQKRSPRSSDDIAHGPRAAVLHWALALAGIAGLPYGAD